MKILIDPIYTSTPARCASHIKFDRIVSYLMGHYENVYVYWLIPSWFDDEARGQLKIHPGIKYLEVSAVVDRLKMYYRLGKELEYKVAFNGDCWDYDFLFTNKTSLAPLYRMLQFRPSNFSQIWMRQIIILEDMPILSFKTTINFAHKDIGNRVSMEGYLASDKTLISAFWEKAEILKLAKDVYSPYIQRQLSEKIIEAAPQTVESVRLKTKAEVMSIVSKEKPFTISYSGRMVLSDQVMEVFDVLEKHWVYRGGDAAGKVRCIMTTASRGSARVEPPKCVDLVYANRDKFWEIVKHESACGLFLSREEDYSMSMIEPLLLGLPMAIINAPHTRASIGEDYPFFVTGVPDAYRCVLGFYTDYAKNYKVFSSWLKGSFLPLLKSRNDTNIITESVKSVEKFKVAVTDYGNRDMAIHTNPITLGLMEGVPVGGVLNFQEKIKQMHKDGELRADLSKKFSDREKRKNTFGSEWNIHRMSLRSRYHFDDAGVEPGTMVRLA